MIIDDMKRILVIYYTQTGQLKQILDSLFHPFSNDREFSVDYLEIQPATPFPFPWTTKEFLGVFPETVMEVPAPLKPFEMKDGSPYDLIVLAFQPWYLSPSPPITAFLKSPEAVRIMKGAEILTITGSRNMWLGAFDRVKAMTELLGGHLCGNIAFIDRAPNLASVITIVYWLFTGKKDRYLGIFPRPGVSDADIEAASRFGQAIRSALQNNSLHQLDHELQALGACEINDSLARLEKRAKKVFTLWARFMIKSPHIRPLLLKIFLIELVLALVIISPLNSLLGLVLNLFKKRSGGR